MPAHGDPNDVQGGRVLLVERSDLDALAAAGGVTVGSIELEAEAAAPEAVEAMEGQAMKKAASRGATHLLLAEESEDTAPKVDKVRTVLSGVAAGLQNASNDTDCDNGHRRACMQPNATGRTVTKEVPVIRRTYTAIRVPRANWRSLPVALRP